MASGYFAPLVRKPVIITEPGSYRTRAGAVVTVRRVSSAHDFGCQGNYANRVPEGWHRSGRLLATSETPNDIVERVTDR